MVGALVAVGQSRLQPHHIQELLAARDLMAYPPNIMAPPDGLFLKHVEYYKSGEHPRSLWAFGVSSPYEDSRTSSK